MSSIIERIGGMILRQAVLCFRYYAQDCRRLSRYDANKATALQKDIQTFKERTARSNRKLARDIAKWVDTAMTHSTGGGSGSGGGGGGPEGDLGVLGEEQGDEEENEGEGEGKGHFAGLKGGTGAGARK